MSRFVPNKVTKHGISTALLQMPPQTPRKSEGFKSSGGDYGDYFEFPILYPSSTFVHMISRTRQKQKRGFGCVKLLSHISSYHTVFCPFEAALLDFALPPPTPPSGWMIPGKRRSKSMIHGTGRKK